MIIVGFAHSTNSAGGAASPQFSVGTSTGAVYDCGTDGAMTNHVALTDAAAVVRELRSRYRKHGGDDDAVLALDVSPSTAAVEFDQWRRDGEATPFNVALNQFRSLAAVDDGKASEIHPAPRPVDQRDAPLPSMGKTFVRPNGDPYLARQLVAHDDVTVLRTCRTIKPRWLGVLLLGNAGTGKTALAEVAHPDLITVQGHGDMTVAHMVGQLMPTHDGGWQFRPGPLTMAMMEGRALLIDEVNKIPSDVLAVVHSAMDGRGSIRLDDRPDDPIITAAEGFCVVATLNPDTLGGTGLTEAINSRFPVQIIVSTDLEAARTMKVPERFITVSENLISRNAANPDAPDLWVPEMRELLAAKTMTDGGLGEEFAARAMLGQCPPEDRDEVADVMGQVFGIDDLAPLMLAQHI